MDWLKLAQYEVVVVALIIMGFLGFTAIKAYFSSKKNGNEELEHSHTTEALDKNTEAFRELITVLKEMAASEKVWREVEAERVLAILVKAGDVEKVVRDNSLKTCQILEQLNHRPCMK